MSFTQERAPDYVKPVINCGKSVTKGSQQKECDINNIIKKFDRTGVLGHMAKHEPVYMETDPVTYQEALNTVIDAQGAFEALPADIRNKFNNDPMKFLEYVQNPENMEEMRELGLAKQVPKTEVITPPEPGETKTAVEPAP